MKNGFRFFLLMLIIASPFKLPAQVDVELHYSLSQNIYYSGTTSFYIDNKLQLPKRMILSHSRDPRLTISALNDSVFLLRIDKVRDPAIAFEVVMYDTLFKDTLRYQFFSQELPIQKVPRLGGLYSGDEVTKEMLRTHLTSGMAMSLKAELSNKELSRAEKLEGGKVNKMDVSIEKDGINKILFTVKGSKFSDEQIKEIMGVQAPFKLCIFNIRINNNKGLSYRIDLLNVLVKD